MIVYLPFRSQKSFEGKKFRAHPIFEPTFFLTAPKNSPNARRARIIRRCFFLCLSSSEFYGGQADIGYIPYEQEIAEI